MKAKPPPYYYSDEDMLKIKEGYLSYKPLAQIAKDVRRDPARVQQKIFRMKLPKRDIHTIRLVNIHGVEIIKKYGHNHLDILRGLKAERKHNLQQQKSEKDRANQKALAQLKKDLTHMERYEAVKKAVIAGARLTDIGRVLGISKQGVSWIIHHGK